MRARAAWLGLAAVAAGLVALPAPATAAECVRVVVDYGTLPGAPAGPNTRCVNVGDDAVAAEALAGRARYKGNFLCAIDGYPESGCGDSGTQPYWSFWIWKNGRWVYASEGVATYRVGDSDGDGHPDPLGFRHHKFDDKSAPRADPSYPKPAATTKPPAPAKPRATTAPPPRQPGSTPAPDRPGTTPAMTSGTTTAGPGAASAGATASATATRAAAPSASAAAAATATAASEAPVAIGSGEPPGPIQAKPLKHAPFPWGAVLGGAVALALIAAGVVQSRRQATP